MALSATSIASLIRVMAKMTVKSPDNLLLSVAGEPGFEHLVYGDREQRRAGIDEVNAHLDSLASIYAAEGFMTALPIPQQLNG